MVIDLNVSERGRLFFLAFYFGTEDNEIMSNTSMEELLKSVESLYLKGGFDEAIKLILEKKDLFEASFFHFNLGTLYAKNGMLAAARFHLEKASASGLTNELVINNLRFVRSRLNVMDLTSSSSTWDRVIDVASVIPADAYLSMSLFLAVIVIFFLWRNTIRTLSGILICLMIASIPLSFSSFYLSRLTFGVALENIQILEGPSKIFPQIGTVKAGSKILIGKRSGDYFLIKHPVTLTGWIKKDDLGLF